MSFTIKNSIHSQIPVEKTDTLEEYNLNIKSIPYNANYIKNKNLWQGFKSQPSPYILIDINLKLARTYGGDDIFITAFRQIEIKDLGIFHAVLIIKHNDQRL